MLVTRAKEILQSVDMIWVVYQDAPIWIESIDPDAATAQVTILGEGNRVDVPVAELHEVGKVN
ncbi:H-type small acid-soluble spore protein [Acetonema longum]|uniref:Small, acid-soluble spore protein h 1 n=1 Tax=Acetonema longum DSM 6540 TaxID=1009370 RepID=F7NGM4_9FIRM|nr:H-type small acid-soluble spore protein [Acetonema longum]EGO64828.1 small, acid-soluble spore protein h 1 [Acetonema longum DSM 6540]